VVIRSLNFVASKVRDTFVHRITRLDVRILMRTDEEEILDHYVYTEHYRHSFNSFILYIFILNFRYRLHCLCDVKLLGFIQ
jgi:hypothetical protein